MISGGLLGQGLMGAALLGHGAAVMVEVLRTIGSTQRVTGIGASTTQATLG